MKKFCKKEIIPTCKKKNYAYNINVSLLMIFMINKNKCTWFFQ